MTTWKLEKVFILTKGPRSTSTFFSPKPSNIWDTLFSEATDKGLSKQRTCLQNSILCLTLYYNFKQKKLYTSINH